MAARAGLRAGRGLPPRARAGLTVTQSSGHNLRRWLTPGIGVKRWLLVVVRRAAAPRPRRRPRHPPGDRDLEPGGSPRSIVDAVTLQFLPYAAPRAARRAASASPSSRSAPTGASRGPDRPVPVRPRAGPLVELIYQKRFLARGPRIVAIGGGTGLSTLLRGLKEHTSNLTAVVAVADDGGSSGVLREELGIPPVGDIRHCIAALADAEPLMGELLQYRFPGSAGGSGAGGGRAARRPRGRQPPDRRDDRASRAATSRRASGR